MQRYWLPGYEVQLLGELQRQQNNAQFCDTLLQTEGISVPAHSCILAARSPYFSQRLSASLFPPSGQKLQLQLPAVKAQTLLKLVGLLYSGVVEVKGSIEQNDLLSAAHQIGITDLVEGQKDEGMKEGELQRNSFGSCGENEEEEGGRERNESRKMQNSVQEVQAERAGRRAADSPIEKRSCVSTGTHTVKAGEKTVGRSFTHSGRTKPRAHEPACSSVAQCLDFSTTLQLQNITLDKHFYSTCFTPIPSVPGGAQSGRESTFDRSSDSVTNPISTSAWSSDVMNFPISLNNDSNSPTPQEDHSYQQSSEFGDRIGTGLKDGKPNAKMADKRENTEQSSCINRDEMLEEEKGNSSEKKCAHVGMKSLAKMKNMMETTQISTKVKLRRRTKGEVWEVVRMQDADETLSVPTSLKEDGSNHKRPQTDPTNGERSSVQPGPIHTPQTQIPQPATTDSPEPPEPTRPNTAPDSQLLCSGFLTPNQNEDPVEESDEQINKMLEDIMMGLNILPNLERDCKKSNDLHPSHDGAPAICQVTATENERAQSQMHDAVSAAGCVYYQDIGTTVDHPFINTAQDQPSCLSFSPEQPDAVVIQQQECSAQYHSSVTSTGQREETSHQSVPLSKSQNCLYPQAPTTRSVLPLAFYSSGQRPHYPASQELSSQDDQNILEFLPLPQLPHSFPLPRMDDLWLPLCHSPLELFASAAKRESSLNNSTNHSNKMQPQPSLPGRPWLAENTGSLQFPLNAITHRENESLSLSQDTNYRCWSKRQQKHLEMNPQSMETWAESCTVKEVEEGGTISAGCQNAAGVKSDPSKMKESSKYQRSDPQGDAAVPKRGKRKCTSHLQDAVGSLLAYKDLKVSDGTRSRSSPSICSVNLSSNNVLAKERNMTTNTSNVPNKCFGKLDETLTITDSWREKTRGAAQYQETPSNTSRENSSVVKPMSCRAQIINNEGLSPPRRKRGRPLKTKPEESPAAIYEKKSHGVEREQQLDNNLLREEEEGEKTKRRCRKWKGNRNEVKVISLKKTISAESTGKAEANESGDIIPAERILGTPKQPWNVTLKEFQKVIEHQHSKTRRSKESQDKETNESAKDVESEEMACASRGEELIKEKEVEIDLTQPQNRDGTEGSHLIFNVTVDKNHNKIFDKSTTEDNGQVQQGDKNNFSKKETSLFGDGYCPLLSFDILVDKAAKSAAEREQLLKNPDHAQKVCDVGGSDTTRQTAINDEGLSHSDTHTLPQDDKMPSDHKVSPTAPQGTGPSLSDAVVFIKSSGCDEDDEEEEQEEVEVDILLYSPDKVPHSSKCENGLENMDTSPEEEEEEDVNEIDVTGDESE